MQTTEYTKHGRRFTISVAAHVQTFGPTAWVASAFELADGGERPVEQLDELSGSTPQAATDRMKDALDRYCGNAGTV